MTRRCARIAVAGVVALGLMGGSATADSFETLKGYDSTAPSKYDNVGVLKIGPKKAGNVLVLNPGTSASAAYFKPLAKQIVASRKDWQVWSVERRENLLEDQSMLDRAKAGKATPKELFDYYLGWLADSSVQEHFEPVADADVPFTREWGMRVAIGDLRRVVHEAGEGGRNVVLGGHSLGGSISTAYATWDFNGKPGADDLNGLVLIDGASAASDPAPTAENAQSQLDQLATSSPFLDLAGNGLVWSAGVFNAVGSTLAIRDPDSPSLLGDFPFLPASLKSDLKVTNEAGYGYALDTETGPENLSLVQMHLGHVDPDGGDPHGWVDGELVPVQRAAAMFSGSGVEGHDGTAWYHPRRLTIDAGAVNGGVPNPAQDVLGVQATHGDDLDLPIFAFGARGGTRITDAAKSLASQSGIPPRKLVLVNREGAYAHCDPLAASPDNAFTKNLRKLLKLSEKQAAHR